MQILFPNAESKSLDSWPQFWETIQREDIGFFRLPERAELLQEAQALHLKFYHKKTFVHLGIGGSSLGPEMLVSALQKNSTQFYFINNIDPDAIKHVLDSIDLKDTLFYVVSKSGGTAETLAAMIIVMDFLKQQKIEERDFHQYFVFATDSRKSELLSYAKNHQIACLEIPENIGGRFSVLTAVGLFPALFAEIDGALLLQGAQKMAREITEQKEKHKLFQTASYIMELCGQGVNQTVLMPYSSRLRNFSFWFVQLWAESLGKKHDRLGSEIHAGLTPIPAYGATDQHSQMQLFMHGPRDKLMLMLEVQEFAADFPLKNDIASPNFKKLSPYTLAELMRAELYGTIRALETEHRPYLHLQIPEVSESYLGELILFFECLTTLVGQCLNVDPFDQPGVEAGKKYAFEWLEKLKK